MSADSSFQLPSPDQASATFYQKVDDLARPILERIRQKLTEEGLSPGDQMTIEVEEDFDQDSVQVYVQAAKTSILEKLHTAGYAAEWKVVGSRESEGREVLTISIR